MPIILKIGFSQYLVKNEAAACKVMTALAGAVAVEWDYEEHRKVYYPSSRDGESEIAITTVAANQLIWSKPAKAKPKVTTPGMELEVSK